MFKKLLTIVFLTISLLLVSPGAMAQCAMCKSNIEKARENGGTNVGNTLNSGILYLLVLPYAIAGVFGFIYIRKNKERKLAEQNSRASSGQ